MLKFSQKFKNQQGIIHILGLMVVVAAIGVILFLLIASSAPLKNKLLSSLFPKKSSFAAQNLPDFDSLTTFKVFGQAAIGETSRNMVTNNKMYHGAGVTVDRTSIPNKIYVVDTGNNRILGYNGVGRCTSSGVACNIDSDCGTGSTCVVDGTKPADIVIGQSDFSSAACNRDNNQGFNKSPSADSLCLMSYPFVSNTAEEWMRLNIDTDNYGNLYVPDTHNNRFLKFNAPFSSDKSNGKGDSIADFVWGQPNFTTNGANNGGALPPFNPPTNKSVHIGMDTFGVTARGISPDPQGNVWVADSFNHRVLRFPLNSNTAELVLGQNDFTSIGTVNCFDGSNTQPPLNKMCNPSLAKVNPSTGELYVLEEYSGPFRARILVFTPPFNNGMSATKVLMPTSGPNTRDCGSVYCFQATGFEFNNYKQNEYANGVIWVNEQQNNRTVLLDKDGNVLKIIGAKDSIGVGGDSQYPGCGVWDDPNQFNLFWPGGSIGFDNGNNIYLADEVFNRVSRYALPYDLRTVTDQLGTRQCLPFANGGIMKGGSKNVLGDEKLGESNGLVVANGQLIVRDENRGIKIWNDYLNKPKFSSKPDIFIKQADLPGGNKMAQAVDENNRLWHISGGGGLAAYQLPFKGNDEKLRLGVIRASVRLFWADDGTEIPGSYDGSIAFDSVNKALYVHSTQSNRIFRIRNYNDLFNGDLYAKLQVDMVLGQGNKTETRCNRGQTQPSATGLCNGSDMKFDKQGNLYVVENNYECHPNDRIIVYLKEDLANAQGMFPNLEAKRVFVGNSFTQGATCDGSRLTEPFSPVSVAFDSQNHLVVANDGAYGGYGYGSGHESERHMNQLWYYNDPLNKQTPDKKINLPMGVPAEMTFDANDNLLIQDGTWYRVFMVNLKTDPSLLISTIPPTPTPIPTPTPVCKYINSVTPTYTCGTNMYRVAGYQCADGYYGILGNSTTCKTNADWSIDAQSACLNHKVCVLPTPTPMATPIPTPKPTPVPTPLPTPGSGPAKLVFVTTAKYRGDLGGIAGADAKCQAAADGVGGVVAGKTWKAWISIPSSGVQTRLSHGTGPYKLLNGTVIANLWSDLVDGVLLAPINVNQSGNTVSETITWSNTSILGNSAVSSSPYACYDFTSTSGTSDGGSSAYTDGRWTQKVNNSCSSLLSLYCFEQ